MKLFNLAERPFDDDPAAAGGGTEVTDPEETEVTEPESGDEPEGDEPSGSDETQDLSEAEIKEAQNLFKLLKDDATRDMVITALAAKRGLLQPERLETKSDVKSATKDIKSILRESLGKDLEWLADKLSPAIENLLTQQREEQQQEISNVRIANLESQIQAVQDKLARETKGASRALEGKMSALAEKFPAGPGISVEEYIRGLYAMANSGRAASNAGKIADRIQRNSRDLPSRLGSRGGGGKDASPKALPKMNIDKSIAYALEQLGFKE